MVELSASRASQKPDLQDWQDLQNLIIRVISCNNFSLILGYFPGTQKVMYYKLFLPAGLKTA